MTETKKPFTPPEKAAASKEVKAAEYEVVKPSHYFRVNDKLQEVKVGHKLTMTPTVAKSLLARKVIKKA